ncbi:MAG TPA: amidohydrolase, partial [Cytophagales bacterium]|nr:amidohydrolase [Cytophagales bacterium]
MKKIFLSTLLLFAVSTGMMAQQPVPAPEQTKKIALTGGIAHLGNGQVIQNSVI